MKHQKLKHLDLKFYPIVHRTSHTVITITQNQLTFNDTDRNKLDRTLTLHSKYIFYSELFKK